MKAHLHLYFVPWRNESRAWRAGTAAIEAGLADKVIYVGHRAEGSPEHEEISSGQSVMRVGAEPPRPGSPRLLRALALPRWWQACLQSLPPEDVSLVVAHSLAALPAAVLLARRAGAPVLYDAHELETERNGWSWPIRKIARLVEGFLIRRVRHTIVVNSSIENWYRAAYPRVSVSTVRNVVDVRGGKPTRALRTRFGVGDDDILFVYCGMLGFGRGLEELIEAFRPLGPERRLVLVGSGPMEQRLSEVTRQLGNVHLHPAVPQSQLIDLLTGADVGVMVPTSSALSYRYCLPNKVFEYAAAGLAVCVGDGPELQRFALSYPAARISAPTAEALREMALSWTREELDRARDLTAAYEPPSWEREREALMDAYRRVGLDRAA